jgi:N-acetylneuraminic acid mutarotase
VYDRAQDEWDVADAANHPPIAVCPAIAYDAESGLIVVFGGLGEQGYTDETWAYDAITNTWADMAPAKHPTDVECASFVYDEQSDLTVLYGSTKRGYGSAPREGWLWAYDVDSNTWTELEITGGPEVPPAYVRGFYDPASDRIVYFGGAAPDARSGDEASNEVWAYDVDSNSWTELAPNPIAGLMLHTFTYVPTLDRAVAFGGGPIYTDEAFGNRLLLYDPATDTWEGCCPVS